MQRIVFVGASVDVSRTVDRSSGAILLAVSDHCHVIGARTIVLPETCALKVNLTADSAVERLKEGQVKWLERTPSPQFICASTLGLA